MKRRRSLTGSAKAEGEEEVGMCVLAVASVRCDDHKITCHVASLPHIQSQLSDKRATGSEGDRRAAPTKRWYGAGEGGRVVLQVLFEVGSVHMRHSKLNRATAAHANDAYLNGVK